MRVKISVNRQESGSCPSIFESMMFVASALEVNSVPSMGRIVSGGDHIGSRTSVVMIVCAVEFVTHARIIPQNNKTPMYGVLHNQYKYTKIRASVSCYLKSILQKAACIGAGNKIYRDLCILSLKIAIKTLLAMNINRNKTGKRIIFSRFCCFSFYKQTFQGKISAQKPMGARG